jgi:hypothetical protein
MRRTWGISGRIRLSSMVYDILKCARCVSRRALKQQETGATESIIGVFIRFKGALFEYRRTRL